MFSLPSSIFPPPSLSEPIKHAQHLLLSSDGFFRDSIMVRVSQLTETFVSHYYMSATWEILQLPESVQPHNRHTDTHMRM